MEEVTDEMLAAAMKKAVELGVVPKHGDTDIYTKNWDAMKQILEAAITAK